MQIVDRGHRVDYVPREAWASLPVQPPAGVWQARMAPVSRAAVVCVAGLLLLGVLALLGVLPWGWVWLPAAPGALLVGAVSLLAALAYRPYCAERRHGYTTWEHSED